MGLKSADALRRLYPGHSVVLSTDFNMNILNHPEVVTIPVEQTPLVTNTVFVPVARGIGTIPGILVDHVQFGVFKASWNVRISCFNVILRALRHIDYLQKYDYLLFIVQVSHRLNHQLCGSLNILTPSVHPDSVQLLPVI